MPSFKVGKLLGLSNIQVAVEDKSDLSSDYFSLTEFNKTFGLGKNSFVINNAPSDILIEILDSSGVPLYTEKAKNVDNVNLTKSIVVSAHIYQQTAIGLGKLILIGTFNKKTVKYTTNIDIVTDTINQSKVRFYSPPSLTVTPLLAFATKINNSDINPKIISGSFYSKAVYPPVDFLLDENFYKKSQTKYQILSSPGSFTYGMKNFFVNLYIYSIKDFSSNNEVIVNITSSHFVKNVTDSATLEIEEPVYYQASSNNKKYVAEVISGSYRISYSDYAYNSSYFTTASYITQSTDLAGNFKFKQYSLAEIQYRNLDTFSGTVTGHRVYRKSLNVASDYELLIDETIQNSEILKIDKSPIKSFENLGYFYTQSYVNNFWFTSSNNFFLTHDSEKILNALKITGSMQENDYVIVKVNTSNINRNASYVPYNQNENLNQSGSAYDSNFIKLLKDNEYVISFNLNIQNKPETGIAYFNVYLTGSYENNRKEPEFSDRFGAKLVDFYVDEWITSKNYPNKLEFKYTPKNDIYGTLVLNAYGMTSLLINELSIKLNNTNGFAPSSYVTKLFFPVNQPNELYDIKAELYDKNSTVVYSNLRSITSFDPNGSSSASPLVSGQSITASNLYVTGQLSLENPSYWGVLEANDLILGWDNSTKEVGYYMAPNLASGSAEFAISASYATTSSFAASAMIWHDTPVSSSDYGEEGWMAYDGDYHYIYSGGRWIRQSVSEF